MAWIDQGGEIRIAAATFADGYAAMAWYDKEGKARIGAMTAADGTVTLPTTDLNPKP